MADLKNPVHLVHRRGAEYIVKTEEDLARFKAAGWVEKPKAKKQDPGAEAKDGATDQ